MARIVRGFVPCAILAVALCAVGCGGDSKAPALAPASGKVMVGETPLANATVTLVGEKGQMAIGMTSKDGVFYLTTNGKDGAPIGKCKVGISVGSGDSGEMDKAPTSAEEYQKYMQKAAQQMAKMNERRNEDKSGDKFVKMTAKYGNPEKSNLTAEIPAGGVKDLMFRLAE